MEEGATLGQVEEKEQKGPRIKLDCWSSAAFQQRKAFLFLVYYF